MHKAARILGIIATLSVIGIAGTIEALNVRAGGILPKHSEYRNGDPIQGLVRWRYSPFTSEKNWLRFRGPRTPDGTPVSRPLSASERSQMELEIRNARAENNLLRVVSSVGLLQYLLVPTLLVLTLANWPAKSKIAWATVQLVVAFCGAFLMLYRGYYSSLGW